MSVRITEIHLPGSAFGIAENGEQTAATMLQRARSYAAYLRLQADQVEAAADGEFQITSYNGVHVQRKRREIQTSTRLS